MAAITVDGKTKVSWVPTVASQTAPTVANLTAGTALEGVLTADGLVGFQPDTAEVDTTVLSSTYNTNLPGRASYSGTMLRLQKTSATSDTLYDTTLVRGATGYIVIRRGITASTAWTANDKVEVYPVTCGETRNLDPEPNSVQRYEVPLFVSPEPTMRAVVAA